MNKNRRSKISEVINKLGIIAGELDGVYDEEEAVYENMPENLQGSQRYSDMEETLAYLDDAKSHLEDAVTALEEVV